MARGRDAGEETEERMEERMEERILAGPAISKADRIATVRVIIHGREGQEAMEANGPCPRETSAIKSLKGPGSALRHSTTPPYL